MTLPYLAPLLNHLWQSTLFAAGAGLLTLLFRRNHASVRHGLWLAASLKFLVPFSLLIGLGSHWEWRRRAEVPAPRAMSTWVTDIGQLVAADFANPQPRPRLPGGIPVPEILFGVWAFGLISGVRSWRKGWQQLRDAAHDASPLALDLPVPAVSSSARIEPGIFGIWSPVLLLPKGIAARLTPAQLQAVIAHELCHARRRDNLAAAAHMVVEVLFWFHPLVWWIRERLVEERERACDEEVLRLAAEPEAYAEGILNVCKFCMESPLMCASGVTGSNLKKRIEEIMTHRASEPLRFGKRLVLSSAAAMAVTVPVLIGVIDAPRIHAQSQNAAAAFEVISVKPTKNADMPGMKMDFMPGGRLSIEGIPLYWLIADAYNVSFQSVRLSGGPSWTLQARYDIEATAEKGAIPLNLTAKEREIKMRPMLQALLADRFKLVVRRETKEMPAYVLGVSRNGPKLKKAAIDEKDCDPPAGKPQVPCHQFMGGQGRGLHGKAVSMADLVSFVENWTDRPMVDKSGIEGLFEIDTDGWTPLIPRQGAGPGEENLADPIRPTLFSMLESQLGLRLEPQKATVDVYIIDRVERPTGN